MVMIGDKLKLEDGRIVKVLGIEENLDGRYTIIYLGRFIEGDIPFEVIKD